MDLMFQPLRKYADFQGRARRAEYWLFLLFVWIVEVAIVALTGALGADPEVGEVSGPMILGYGLLGVFGLAILVPSLALSVRRLHDTNRSGWWLLVALIPFLGALVLIVFSLLDGTPGPNRFGEDPKGRASPGATVAAA